jgi:deoxyribonuclease V
MIAAFDVHYSEDERASAAAVLFHNYTDAEAAVESVGVTDIASCYMPGQFYRRELPCILRLLEQFEEAPDEMLIDGYVMLGARPGLGQHLFESLSGNIPVIGVAKSKYRNSRAVEIFRGRSTRPLYVTSAGIDPQQAAERIRLMHGAHRLPTLLNASICWQRGKYAERKDRLLSGA